MREGGKFEPEREKENPEGRSDFHPSQCGIFSFLRATTPMHRYTAFGQRAFDIGAAEPVVFIEGLWVHTGMEWVGARVSLESDRIPMVGWLLQVHFTGKPFC